MNCLRYHCAPAVVFCFSRRRADERLCPAELNGEASINLDHATGSRSARDLVLRPIRVTRGDDWPCEAEAAGQENPTPAGTLQVPSKPLQSELVRRKCLAQSVAQLLHGETHLRLEVAEVSRNPHTPAVNPLLVLAQRLLLFVHTTAALRDGSRRPLAVLHPERL